MCVFYFLLTFDRAKTSCRLSPKLQSWTGVNCWGRKGKQSLPWSASSPSLPVLHGQRSETPTRVRSVAVPPSKQPCCWLTAMSVHCPLVAFCQTGLQIVNNGSILFRKRGLSQVTLMNLWPVVCNLRWMKNHSMRMYLFFSVTNSNPTPPPNITPCFVFFYIQHIMSLSTKHI